FPSPLSSLDTMPRSSSSASSKLKSVTSELSDLSFTVISTSFYGVLVHDAAIVAQPQYSSRRRDESTNVRGRARRQGIGVVPALETRHQPTAAGRLRDMKQLLRRPLEILRLQGETGQGIGAVRVEACRNQKKLRLELDERRDQTLAEALPELG